VPLKGRQAYALYGYVFPLTHGAAARWYRVPVERLVWSGVTVTYLHVVGGLTSQLLLRGGETIAESRASELYDGEGARVVGPKNGTRVLLTQPRG